MMTLTVIGSSMLASNDPNSTYWIIPLMLGIGALVGLINGLVVSYLRVPSLIATLGMMITLTGVAFVWSGGAPRGYLPDTFRFFGRFNITGVPLVNIFSPVAIIRPGGARPHPLVGHAPHQSRPHDPCHRRQSAGRAPRRRTG